MITIPVKGYTDEKGNTLEVDFPDGTPDEVIAEALRKHYPPKQQPENAENTQKPVPWYKEAGQYLSPLVRFAAPVVGGVGAGIAATPESFGAATIPAGALGYAGGVALADAYDRMVGIEPPKSQYTQVLDNVASNISGGSPNDGSLLGNAGQAMRETAGNILSGLQGEMMGQSGIGAMQQMSPYFAAAARRMYASAMKPQQYLWRKDPKRLEGILDYGLDNAIYPSWSGSARAGGRVSRLMGKADDVIEKDIQYFSPRDQMVMEPANDLLAKRSYNSLTGGGRKEIEGTIQDYLFEQPRVMSTKKAMSIVKQTYKNLKKAYENPAVSSDYTDVRKALARGLKDKTYSLYPENLSGLRHEAGRAMEVEQMAADAAKRIGNRNLIPLDSETALLAAIYKGKLAPVYAAAANIPTIATTAGLALRGLSKSRLQNVSPLLAYALQNSLASYPSSYGGLDEETARLLLESQAE